MKLMQSIIYLSLFSCLVACSNMQTHQAGIYDHIPSLDELSGIWVSPDTVDMEPSIRNFRGQALANRDLTSVSWFASAPYSGGYHTGSLRINGETPKASSWRWQPYQALRKGNLDQLEILSSTRMLFEEDAIMWQVDITNTSDQPKQINIELDMIGFISKYDGHWQWWYPYPKMDGKETNRDEEVENVRRHIGESVNSKKGLQWELINGKPTQVKATLTWPTDQKILAATKYSANLENNTIFIRDTETDARVIFRPITKPDQMQVKNSGGTAIWNRTLNPGETQSINYLMTYGDDFLPMKEKTELWANDFHNYFNGIQNSWEQKWKDIFTPGNSLISGTFPILETDDAKAKKVYYTSPLTMLYLTHTNLPQHEKVFLTGGPRWGASITFFWDITLWSTLWAVVDPAMMREHLSAWIYIDPSQHYGKDNFGGQGVGNAYSANYWALFQMIRDYILVSGDEAYLDEVINGKSVLQHLENYALNWQNLSLYQKDGLQDEMYKLADFGDDEWNLLECVPTYKHIVPSFNVGYAWMMRETAKFYQHRNQQDKAQHLNTLASEKIARILELYAGEGVWYSLYPDGSKIEIRHCLDFSFLGKYIPDDIPQEIRDDMIAFLYRELMTDHWMRAQSLQDIAAKDSDRTDHGPLGAFDGWPADVMDALTQMGYRQKALDFYHAIEPVTYEGIWAQAHELWGEHKETPQANVRIAQRGWHNRESSSGIAFAQVMLRNFFGFRPQINGEVLMDAEKIPLSGKLHHVYYRGEYYTIELKNGIPEMVRE